MLRTLKDLFDTLLVPVAAAQRTVAPEHRLHLATAVLLVEVMRADAECSAAERQAVLGVLQQRFALADDEVARLLELAEHSAKHATDFHAFTSALNEQLDHEQKLQVVEAMWAVAYADGHLAAHENHVLWRVADLLHLPHGAYIHAKLRAKAAAGV
ncbi:MAG: TerB family tellurite resistance protein [Rubrivivax sp.]|nr:TerB family tellurite resistance protein [Rubrivivax sp.]